MARTFFQLKTILLLYKYSSLYVCVNFCPELQDTKQTENFYSFLLIMEAQGILTLVRGLVDAQGLGLEWDFMA